MLEKDITAAIMRLLKAVPRCFAWKEHGGMYGSAGVPDVICCLDGRFFAFEVKTPEGRLTKLQENTIHKINPEYQTLLELRYLCFKNWEDISTEMDYSLRRLYELHNLALEQIFFKSPQ